jgi:hypothetical protein
MNRRDALVYGIHEKQRNAISGANADVEIGLV